MDTKALIANAAYRLLQKKPITKLTLTEIGHEAGVSKRTVYNHFQDKFEIAQYLCKQIDDAFFSGEQHSVAEYCGENPLPDSSYISEHADFFRNVLCYVGQNSLMDYMAERFLQRLLHDIRMLQGCDEISEEILAAAEFFAYSSVYCSYEMLKGSIPRRYLNTDKSCMNLYMPAPLLNLFTKKQNADTP